MIRLSYALLVCLVGCLAVYAVLHPSWLALPALLLGWYLADMASGLIHMTFDYLPCPRGKGLDIIYFYEGSREADAYLSLRRAAMARIHPFWRLVYDFKNHHPRPDALGRRTVTEQIWSTVVAGSVPLAIALTALCIGLRLPGWVAAASVSLLIGASYAQFFHGTLHRAHNPWIVRAMRRVGLLMTPQAHQLHHDTLRRDFATNCGWSNPLLNRVFALLHHYRILRDEGLEPAG